VIVILVLKAVFAGLCLALITTSKPSNLNDSLWSFLIAVWALPSIGFMYLLYYCGVVGVHSSYVLLSLGVYMIAVLGGKALWRLVSRWNMQLRRRT